MIEIKFQGNSIENIVRQIVAFAEKIEIKEGGKKNGKTVGSRDRNLGERQSE